MRDGGYMSIVLYFPMRSWNQFAGSPLDDTSANGCPKEIYTV
jgi:hypothetical protein